MIGDAARNDFRGFRGADVFNGGAAGGQDQDRISYREDFSYGGGRGIVVDLEVSVVGGNINGTVRDGFGFLDRTVNIERVEGTRFADVFVGSSVRNVFLGGEGRDFYNGEGGFDTVRLDRGVNGDPSTGAVVNLALASGQIINDGFGNRETCINVEQIEGTDRGDRLIGNNLDNNFIGREGLDVMTGALGRDSFEWWEQSHFGNGDVITDFTVSGVNADVLLFEYPRFAGMTATLRLVNGATALTNQGTFLFNTVTDILSWDRDGTGAAAAVAVVKLTGVTALTAANFELFA
jgi:hypothetical protein